jgi:hypothetical protein
MKLFSKMAILFLAAAPCAFAHTGTFGGFSCDTSSGIHVDVSHVFGPSSEALRYGYLYTNVNLIGSVNSSFETQKKALDPIQDKETDNTVYPYSYTDSNTGFAINIKTVDQSAYAHGTLILNQNAKPENVTCTYDAAFELSPPMSIPSSGIEN